MDESKTRFLYKPNQRFREAHPGKAVLWSSHYGLTQACRLTRSELSPLYKAYTIVHVEPRLLSDYINTFLAVPGVSDDQIVGSVIIDVECSSFPRDSSYVDIRPLLPLLRRAKNLYIGVHDIVTDNDVECLTNTRSIQDTLTLLYDIVDMDAFYDYVEKAMTALEIEYDGEKGVEIIFELGPEYWEDWMEVWSKLDHLPDYRIPLDLGDRVVEWGRGCGMELNRLAGSHLTVNYRRGT
jgi:hypothetical protein